jgi:hypothetical protein
MSSCPIFFCDLLQDKIVYTSLRVEGLFVLRPVADLDFVPVFSGLSRITLTSTLNDIIYYFLRMNWKFDKVLA